MGQEMSTMLKHGKTAEGLTPWLVMRNYVERKKYPPSSSARESLIQFLAKH
jgi:hypothetical protein